MSKAVSANKTPEDLIKYHQEQMSACEMSFVENAYEAGRILNEQKTKLAHGKFSDWCKEHWHKSRRTATDYMLLAENLKPTQISSCVSIAQAKKLLPSKSASVADLPSKPTVKGRPMPGGKSPKGVHQREPGDESEPDGEDPIVEPPKSGTAKPQPGPIHKQAVSSYFSPLVRATKKLSDINGGEGEVYKQAKHHLNEFSAAFKKLGKGEQ